MSQLGFITQLVFSGGQLTGSGLRVSGFNAGLVTVSGNAPAILPAPGVSGQVPTSTASGYIQWSTPGAASLGSGVVLSGMLAASDTTAPVASGNIASGVVGNVHIRSGGLLSGAIGSGILGTVHVASGGYGSGAFGSGQIGTAHVTSGGFLSGAFGSGQISHPHFGSGAVLSGDIASGQIGVNHFASGTVANQTLQEAGASLTSFVSPGTQQYHPSACKAWVRFSASGGTPSIGASYNVSSITDNGVGDFTVNFSVAFSSADYAYSIQASNNDTNGYFAFGPIAASSATSFRFEVFNFPGTAPQDLPSNTAAFWGDQ